MPDVLKLKARYMLDVAVSFAPWVISMYSLYWIEVNEIWTSETLHRDKMTVAILVTGMALSFLVHSRIAKRGQK